MRRLFILLLLIAPVCAHAVLKEKDLDQTLLVLQSELESYHNDLTEAREKSKEQRIELQRLLASYLEEANQISLMVYSQQQDYIFDLTYACHQATDLYNRFHSNQIPFDTLKAQLQIEVQRYEGLVAVLRDISGDTLDATKTASRAKCIELAAIIHKELAAQRVDLLSFEEKYNKVDRQLSELHAYATARYKDIQSGIFLHKGEGYLSLLRNFYKNAAHTSSTMSAKYKSPNGAESQWRGTVVYMVFAIMLIYGLIAMLIGYLLWRFVLPRFPRLRNEFETPLNTVLCFALTTFAIVVGIVNIAVSHNFIRMATELLVQFAWLASAIQISLIIRMNGEQEKAGLKIYIPLLLMGFIVIVMRIIFVPGAVVSLYFPPILLLIALWQWRLIHRYSAILPHSDSVYAWITFFVMVFSLVLAVAGRTLMGVELLIWWMMQITCIQTIVCLYDLLNRYEAKVIEEGADIRRTWFLDLINKVVLPITAVASFLFSIYWSADVFDMSEWVWDIYLMSFVSIDGVIHLSIWRVCTVISLFFVSRFIMYIVRETLKMHYSGEKYNNGRGAIVIGNNVASILVWGGYLIISMLLLGIGNSWILVITGGLSTGIGFAMKDTLENFFYGVSLMLGRLHIGDVIECDGVRGTVSNISYQSTTVQTSDGAEMAFLNSQLFSKNFKNMTRNHNLELVVIPIGVAYGSNVQQVREMLTAAISPLDCYDRGKGISVGFMDFGASSVDLKVCVWVDVLKKAASVAMIKEVIYDTLNRNNVEIPFPQLDIHQR